MKKQNRLYEIFEVTLYDVGLRDHEEIEKEETYVGEQWAVSEAQAVSRYCYKNGCRSYEYYEWAGDTGRVTRIVARLKK